MALRRRSKPAQTQFDAITDRLDRIEKAVAMARQSGPSSVQLENLDTHIDPAPGEVAINWPGVHTPATIDDPFMYYHPGDTPIGGSTPAGWKRLIGELPAAGGDAAAVCYGTRSGYTTSGSFNVDWGDVKTNRTDIFDNATTVLTNDTIHVKAKGVVLFIGQASVASPALDWGVSWTTGQHEPSVTTIGELKVGRYNGGDVGKASIALWGGFAVGSVPGPATYIMSIVNAGGSKTYDQFGFLAYFLPTDFQTLSDIV